MGIKSWKIIPRPLLETVLHNHARHHLVRQPLILHGSRGVGKTTLILERLLGKWNEGPHLTGYVDFGESVVGHHPCHGRSFPWTSWSNFDPPPLSELRSKLEACLESMAYKAIGLGSISSHQIYATLNKSHGLNTALSRTLYADNKKMYLKSARASTLSLWDRAVSAMAVGLDAPKIMEILGWKDKGEIMLNEDMSYLRESIAALKLAKRVIEIQQKLRVNAVRHLNQTGGFSRPLAHSSCYWPSLLFELLSASAEMGHFQPKLVINNIDVLRNAAHDDNTTVCASQYHDSLIWKMIALGVNEQSMPIILLTADSYYSYRAFMEFGIADVFISRETFGWTPDEAKMHMVDNYFSDLEWTVISEVIGPNPRHLFEIYALKQSIYHQKIIEEKLSTIEDIIDTYLAHLQITEVNPAMDKALEHIQRFAADASSGKISKDRLGFGAPWRHPPSADNHAMRVEWAKIQLLDFLQSLVQCEFGVNYLADYSLEIMDDPSAVAMIEVGLLYIQRDSPIIRPISRCIERCLARWLVQEKLSMGYKTYFQYIWQRIIRGRSYRHLLLQIGYKK